MQKHTPVPATLHVSLIALPDGVIATLAGLFDALNAVNLIGVPGGAGRAPFQVEIVGEQRGEVLLASGIPIRTHRGIDEIERTDIVIVPSLLLPSHGWVKGRYPKLVEWVRRMHERGALLGSACSGLFLLAETGCFDGRDATVHFQFAPAFEDAFPTVRIHPERVLVAAGERDELVCSGASTSWHDMVLYLIARFAGATEAQAIARFMALQWHHDGLTPFMSFEGRQDHGDAVILSVQQWLSANFSVAQPVEEMTRISGLADRSFKRRFQAATGYSPLDYVQRLRVQDAKRRLERTEAPIDEISWRVGYEDPAFFRRLFKRLTGITPGAYRKRFCLPDFARP